MATKSNRRQVGEGLDLLVEGMKPFVIQEMKRRHDRDWVHEIAEIINKNPSAPKHKITDDIPWDTSLIASIIEAEWRYLFRNKLGSADRSMLHEVRDVRNRWAHQKAFSLDDTIRALDTIWRLLSSVSAGEQAAEVDRIKQSVMRVRYQELAKAEEKKASKEIVEGTPTSGLPAWREVVTPHPDVASGSFAQAEFAADLSQVLRGEAADEYGNPKEFFRRTFLTDGLSSLLTGAADRLSNKGGDPVIELQTNFGGGKTHSMLALYHMFSGVPINDLPGLDGLLKNHGVEKLPTAARAVLVGTALSPAEVHKKKDGCEINTMWGEMAWQLGGKKAYNIIKDSDQKRTAPGSDLLTQLFEHCGPTLVLIDEWVAFIRQMFETDGLPAGSFDANITFAQSLTEAAKSPNVLVVATLPQSRIEVGGEGGQRALDILQNTFTRIKSSWRPANQEESYEIVRRRLFEPVEPDKAPIKDAVINEFSKLYQQQQSDFPSNCKEGDYRRKLDLAYPIHPELFETLYTAWASREEFQRTRGVLRLMASVIHSLWRDSDKNLMILPSLIPMDDSTVLGEITTKSGLANTWQSVVDTDVDGDTALSRRVDGGNPNFGRYHAARRVARTIYMASAPIADTSNRGVADERIKLGCVQPGENPAIFGDALRRLTDNATHLYVDGNRYWFDTQPSVTRLAKDRAQQFANEDVLHAIKQRLRDETRAPGDFAKVHNSPESSADVPDETEVRLVILDPATPHVRGNDDSPAMTSAKDILVQRGSSPRINRNSLLFIAADQTRLEELKDAVRQHLAWHSINKEKESLNLDSFQRNQAETKTKESDETIKIRISETYHWALCPSQSASSSDIEWRAFKTSGTDRLPVRTSAKLVTEEQMFTNYSGVRLRMALDDIPLWRGNHVSTKQLLSDTSQYLYLPRLVNQQTLVDAINQGLRSLTWLSDGFAYADAYDEDKDRYLGLKEPKDASVVINSDSVLVKPEIAKAQIDAETQTQTGATGGSTASPMPAGGGTTSTPSVVEDDGSGEAPVTTRFYGRATLNSDRVGKNAGDIAENVIAHLSGLEGSEVVVTIEVQATNLTGFDDHIIRTVTENCRTLKFDSHEFEDN